MVTNVERLTISLLPNRVELPDYGAVSRLKNPFFFRKPGSWLNPHGSDIKGTGTRDLIWLKVISLDRSWLVGLTEDL